MIEDLPTEGEKIEPPLDFTKKVEYPLEFSNAVVNLS